MPLNSPGGSTLQQDAGEMRYAWHTACIPILLVIRVNAVYIV